MQPTKRFTPNSEDTRTHNEKILTDKLSRSLTQLNLQRVTQHTPQITEKQSDRKNFLYVCITGSPPLPNQFEGIGIPGETIMVYPQGLQPTFTAEQSKARIEYATMEKQAESLHERLKDRRDKPMVFVLHSFGTAIFSTFLHFYHDDYKDRVVGIIAIGFYPIRPDYSFKMFIDFTQSLTKQQLITNVDPLYQKHKEFHKMSDFAVIKDKYAYSAYLTAFGQGLGVGESFEFNKRWYPVLKCFIYGREDARIEESLMNESAIYYAYKRTLGKEYEQQVRDILRRGYKMQSDEVQERFIYNLEGGKHSVHVQKRLKPTVAAIISEYLSVLEQLVL